MKLTDSLVLHQYQLKNRLVMPPMVSFGLGCSGGDVTARHIHHYLARAQAGTGLIILEATAVLPEGRLSLEELGLWRDEQIPGLAHVAEACHMGGAMVLVQLHHAGPATCPEAGPRVGPSAYTDAKGSVQSLTPEEIAAIRRAFTQAALRAREAGADGVELHGCHGYLLNAFAHPGYNRREDAYGSSTEGRTRLACEIIQDIQSACGDDFIVTVRMGGNDPDLEESRRIAECYIQAGVHGLNVSSGMDGFVQAPEGFPLDGRFYLAQGIRQQAAGRVPVMGVGGVRSGEQAQAVLDAGCADLVCVGRAMLADDQFAAAALQCAAPTYPCRGCKGGCRWPMACPALKIRRQDRPASPF